MQQVPNIIAFENITSDGFYLPILRVDEHGSATPDLVDQWKGQVGIALKARDGIRLGGIIAGPVLLAVCAAVVVAMVLRRRRGGDLDLGRINSETRPLFAPRRGDDDDDDVDIEEEDESDDYADGQ